MAVSGRVIAIDVPWTNPDRARALLIRNDRVDVVDIRGNAAPLRLPERE